MGLDRQIQGFFSGSLQCLVCPRKIRLLRYSVLWFHLFSPSPAIPACCPSCRTHSMHQQGPYKPPQLDQSVLAIDVGQGHLRFSSIVWTGFGAFAIRCFGNTINKNTWLRLASRRLWLARTVLTTQFPSSCSKGGATHDSSLSQ